MTYLPLNVGGKRENMAKLTALPFAWLEPKLIENVLLLLEVAIEGTRDKVYCFHDVVSAGTEAEARVVPVEDTSDTLIGPTEVELSLA